MTVVLTINDVGVPKRTLVEMAYNRAGSAGYEFERTAEEVASALNELEAMMYEHPWSLLGFAHSSSGVGEGQDLSGIPNDAIAAVAGELALRIAPEMGATLSSEARTAMARSRLLVSSQYATIPTAARARNTPRGAGNRGWGGPFIHDDAAT